MSDRFDELLDPGKAAGLRKELRRLFPARGPGIVPPGMVYMCSEPEYVGRMPVRSEIPIEWAWRCTVCKREDIYAETGKFGFVCSSCKNPPFFLGL